MEYQKRSVDRHIRLTPAEFSRIQVLAKLYAGGNITRWLVYGALHVAPKFLCEKKKGGK